MLTGDCQALFAMPTAVPMTENSGFFSIIDHLGHSCLGEKNAMSEQCPLTAVDLGGPREMIDDPASGAIDRSQPF